MARGHNRLSARGVTTETGIGLHADGGGLYLKVTNSASGAATARNRSWIFRYMQDGKAEYMGLGSLRDVSLAQAREKAAEQRRLLSQGINPRAERDARKAAAHAAAANAKSFKECAESYIEAHGQTWRNEKHRDQWETTLKTYVYPVFGALPVSDVDTALVLKVLEPIWREKTETASRIRGRMERIFDWATVRRFRSGENPARWRGHLDQLLAAPRKIIRVRHYPALPYTEIGGFMADLRTRHSVSALGLEFLVLTAARTGETIGARWTEFDLNAKVWTVPADRMKSGKEHRIPLSTPALSVLEKARQLGSEFVFPGRLPMSHLSVMAFLNLLDRMGRGDLTAHGFRSTFRDWVSERTAFPREVAEAALAHAIVGDTEKAYRRGDLLDKRRHLMESWASYCAQIEDDEKRVIPIRRAE